MQSPTISLAWGVTLQLHFVLRYRFHLYSSESPSFWHCTAGSNYTAVHLITKFITQKSAERYKMMKLDYYRIQILLLDKQN
jgi:hypothetical protein